MKRFVLKKAVDDAHALIKLLATSVAARGPRPAQKNSVLEQMQRLLDSREEVKIDATTTFGALIWQAYRLRLRCGALDESFASVETCGDNAHQQWVENMNQLVKSLQVLLAQENCWLPLNSGVDPHPNHGFFTIIVDSELP